VGVGVDETQRSHAIRRNAYFVIPDDHVPAVRPLFENGDELTAVVDAEPG
jgi:hypothetical protein